MLQQLGPLLLKIDHKLEFVQTKTIIHKYRQLDKARVGGRHKYKSHALTTKGKVQKKGEKN